MRKLKIPLICALALILCASSLLLTAPGVNAATAGSTYTLKENLDYVEDIKWSSTSFCFFYKDSSGGSVQCGGFRIDSSGVYYTRSNNNMSAIKVYDFDSDSWIESGSRTITFAGNAFIAPLLSDWVDANIDNSFSVKFYDHNKTLKYTLSSNSSITLSVTPSGGTFTTAEGEIQTYTYSGPETFKGFSTSSTGSATYTPGNTYTLTSAASIYAVIQYRPTYKASLYNASGSLIQSTATSYSPLQLSVTASGATITLADGDPITYIYSGSEIFAGLGTSSSGAAVYTPGNTYTLSGSSTSLYVKETKRPTYQASIYHVGGSLHQSTAISYSPLELIVTTTGATIKLQDGETVTYTYTGSEIFAGFATSSSGSVIYSPGNTYPLSSASVKLYAKESPRPTYTITLYDIGQTSPLASETSYGHIKLTVTTTGAKFVADEGEFVYEYPGSEIFTGFATSANGTPTYVPGKTYTISAANTKLYAQEKDRPIYTISVVGPDGSQIIAPFTSYSPIKFTITSFGAAFSLEDGTKVTYSYDGEKQFLGFASEPDAAYAAYSVGYAYFLDIYTLTLYVVDREIDIGALGDSLDVFGGIGAGLASVLATILPLFYSDAAGLTFLGWLAIAGLALSVILLLFFFIRRWFFPD